MEEAAEILEARLICTLTEHTKHLIMIGDHRQLKPRMNNVQLERQRLNLSLFERLITQNVGFVQLQNQRRMRPAISRYIRNIYDSGYDDFYEEKHFEKVKGIRGNVLFIQMLEGTESEENSTKSKLNKPEAYFAARLCSYILSRGQFQHNQITILTMYLGQKKFIRGLIKKKPEYKKLSNVRVTTVDKFQGEENEIIILSLVRSNEKGEIGFIGYENRINVALSRAKTGLYVIGDLDMVSRSRSTLWKQTIQIAEEQGCKTEGIELELCPRHGKTGKATKANHIENWEDFACLDKCEAQMECGHAC